VHCFRNLGMHAYYVAHFGLLESNVSRCCFLATPILAYTMEASPFLIGLIGASGRVTYAIMTRVYGSVYDVFFEKENAFFARA